MTGPSMPHPFALRQLATPHVAEIALNMAAAGELDHVGLARLAATIDGRPDVGGLTPLTMATAYLRGLLDEDPANLVTVVALGLTSAATGVLGTKMVAAAVCVAVDDNQDDEAPSLVAAAV